MKPVISRAIGLFLYGSILAEPLLERVHADPATFVSVDWNADGDTSATATANCTSIGCNLSIACSPPPHTFSRMGQTLPASFSEIAQSSAGCTATCSCCTIDSAAGSATSRADISILSSSGPSQTHWNIGATLYSTASASASPSGATCSFGPSDGSADTTHHWELSFTTNCSRLVLNRTHAITIFSASGPSTAISTITLQRENQVPPVFQDEINESVQGTINHSGASEILLGQGQYTNTIDSQLHSAATAGNSSSIQVFASCDLNFYPYSGPLITSAPTSREVCRGGSTTFNVAANGASQLAHQWRRGGVNLSNGLTANGSTVSGATENALVISNIQVADGGTYDCLVSDSCGSTPSWPPTSLTVYASGSGDGNGDGQTVGNDIRGFVNALLSGGPPSFSYCRYDMNSNGIVQFDDVPLFVTVLLN